jgi:hypothetical protein
MAGISGSVSGAVSNSVSMSGDDWDFSEISNDGYPVVFGGEATTFGGEDVIW